MSIIKSVGETLVVQQITLSTIRLVKRPVLQARPAVLAETTRASHVVAAVFLAITGAALSAVLVVRGVDQNAGGTVAISCLRQSRDFPLQILPFADFVAFQRGVCVNTAAQTEGVVVGTQPTERDACGAHIGPSLGLSLGGVHVDDEVALRHGAPAQAQLLDNQALALRKNPVEQIGALQKHWGPMQVQHLTAVHSGAAQTAQAFLASSMGLQVTCPTAEAELVAGAARQLTVLGLHEGLRNKVLHTCSFMHHLAAHRTRTGGLWTQVTVRGHLLVVVCQHLGGGVEVQRHYGRTTVHRADRVRHL